MVMRATSVVAASSFRVIRGMPGRALMHAVRVAPRARKPHQRFVIWRGSADWLTRVGTSKPKIMSKLRNFLVVELANNSRLPVGRTHI
jgi:hypothetical protein